jgi:hypothetical protein
MVVQLVPHLLVQFRLVNMVMGENRVNMGIRWGLYWLVAPRSGIAFACVLKQCVGEECQKVSCIKVAGSFVIEK